MDYLAAKSSAALYRPAFIQCIKEISIAGSVIFIRSFILFDH